MTDAAAFTEAPPGFQIVDIGGVFASHNGPLFGRWTDSRLQLGFRVGPLQVNPGNACHGGMLSTFADILLSCAAHYQTDIPRTFLPTISLQLDFIAAAPLGSWVQGQADILRVTRNLIFSQALIHADGTLALRTSGVFKRGPLLPETPGDRELALPGMPARGSAAR
jgi:uncharacterized protein (TIGR00369 family)